MKKKQVTWEMDEYGFVHNVENFIDMKAVRFLTKEGDDLSFTIGFDGGGIRIKFVNKKERDDIYQWFIKCRIAVSQAYKKDEEVKQRLFQASVEIQNRMAGNVCK